MTGRVLGIDFGRKRIGLALSDPLGITAQPLGTLANRRQSLWSELGALVRQRQVKQIVVGLPKHMSGDEGEKALEARVFGERLSGETGIAVDYLDERLTTVAVQRMLSETDMSGAKKRAVTDKLSAVLLLQMWLDRERNQGKRA